MASRTFEIKKVFIEVDDTLYEVIRTVHESKDLDIDEWKTRLMCDKLLRKNEILYFCRTIDEAIVITDEPKIHENNESENKSSES